VRARNSFLLRATFQKSGSAPRSPSFAMTGASRPSESSGEDEADPAKGSISYVSPLARAMLGKIVGDVITAGKDEAEITLRAIAGQRPRQMPD
jgi:hypothetical protein